MQIRARRPLPLIAAAVLAAAAVAWATGLLGSSHSVGPSRANAASLQPFGSCDELRGYVREHEWARDAAVYPYALRETALPATLSGSGGVEDSATAMSSDSVGPSATGTNVQEAGVDEPDLAKLGGETLFVVERGELRALDVGGEEPLQLGSVRLPGRGAEAELLLAGETVLVVRRTYDRSGWAASTVLTEVDVSDPTAMTAVSELEVEGDQVSARLRDQTVHLVVESSPGFGGVSESGGAEEPRWLPEATATDLLTGDSDTGPLFGCEAVSYPKRFAGLGLLSVLTLDLSSGLSTSDVDTVMADGTTVYASPSSLYVATAAIAPPERMGIIDAFAGLVGVGDVAPPVAVVPDETDIHRFDIADPASTSYASSGRVDGRILNEWSFSEYGGNLRVATTEGDPWSEGAAESESAITVLAESDGVLEEVGRAGGLGRGEEIYGVRFIEEMGYVVTFEQTDPLYAVDLSDPGAPRATGELKIPGYSAYLHPVGDGRLLGIGQGGTKSGTLTGAQASLFDVTDADSPQRLATLELAQDGYGSASTEWDHHAFAFSPELSLALVPVESYGRDSFTGAVAMAVDPEEGLTELGRFEDGAGPIERMFVVGERLVTLSRGEVTSRELPNAT